MSEMKFDITKVIEGAIKEFQHQGYTVTKWTSVDKALPDNGNEVLIWYEYFRYGEYNCMYQTYGLARYIHGSWTGEDLNATKVKVLYWQPLPEPPETKKNNVLK